METSAANPRALSQLSKGYIICVTGTLVWSSTAIFIRYLTAVSRMPALQLAFWRDFIVSISLAIVFLVIGRSCFAIDRRHLPFLVFYGFILSIFNSLWTISVALNGAAVSTVLVYSSSAFTAVLGWWLFKEELPPLKILAVGLSILGCVYVAGAQDLSAWVLNPLGILTGLLSGVAFASYSLLGKSASQRGINPWTALLYSFAFAAVLLAVYNLLPTPRAGSWLSNLIAQGDFFWRAGGTLGWTLLIILAVGPTVGGYGLYTVSLTYLPASVANLIATLEPAFTAALAYLFLGERLSISQLFGSAVILTGVVLLRLGQPRNLKPK